VHFVQDSIPKNGFDETTLDLLQNIASGHSTNFTRNAMKMQDTNSVEEAVYAVLYQHTLLNVSSQNICRIINWMVNTDCFSFELTPTVQYINSEYFNRIGYQNFKNLINYHTVNSFLREEALTELANAFLAIPSFNTSLEIRQDLIHQEKVSFQDEFLPKLDPKLSYERNADDNIYSVMMKQPIALFFYMSVCILVTSSLILFNDSRFNRRDDLLKSHFQSASRALREKQMHYDKDHASVNDNSTTSS
jgi:hypothetical protein